MTAFQEHLAADLKGRLAEVDVDRATLLAQLETVDSERNRVIRALEALGEAPATTAEGTGAKKGGGPTIAEATIQILTEARIPISTTNLVDALVAEGVAGSRGSAYTALGGLAKAGRVQKIKEPGKRDHWSLPLHTMAA